MVGLAPAKTAIRKPIPAEVTAGRPQYHAHLIGDQPTPAATSAADVLGIDPEVRAFARVICLRNLIPPLSIGLFGTWGAGKTTFMYRLQHAIESLAAQQPGCEQAEGDSGRSPFIARVVQIWFNAWQYADANPCASLADEIFAQLWAGGHIGGDGQCCGTPADAVLASVGKGRIDSEQGPLARLRRSLEILDGQLRHRSFGPEGNEQSPATAPAVDRIVIYIDNLDRCRHEQVVRVLEAVHLMLAFPHFVVIVGADARWLGRSLADHYQGQLGWSADDTGHDSATPIDYLEKIFQIPFWLRPLDVDHPEGSFGRLIDELARVTDRPAGASGSQPAPELARAARPVTLTQPEIELLKRLGPLAGKSPRAVKRLVNVYRLIRSTFAENALAGFLGGDRVALYPAVMLMLAADIGLDRHTMARFRHAITAPEPTIALDTVFALADDGLADVLVGEPDPAASRVRPVVDVVCKAYRDGGEFAAAVRQSLELSMQYSFRGPP